MIVPKWLALAETFLYAALVMSHANEHWRPYREQSSSEIRIVTVQEGSAVRWHPKQRYCWSSPTAARIAMAISLPVFVPFAFFSESLSRLRGLQGEFLVFGVGALFVPLLWLAAGRRLTTCHRIARWSYQTIAACSFPLGWLQSCCLRHQT